MNFLKISAIAFAALLSVSAHAQIITNYGQATYPGSTWNGDWTGSGASLASTKFTAQTFTAITDGPIYAYNVQFNVLNGATPSFTTAIYEWTGTTLGSLIANTTATFSFTADSGFNIYGSNVVTNPGLGTTNLTAGALYALVITRTDTGPNSTTGIAQVGRVYNDPEYSGINYTGGSAYTSSNGTTFASVPGDADNAFWISFDPASLSPVPEPAVNGAIIGAVFVLGLIGYRRYGKKSAAPVDQVVA